MIARRKIIWEFWHDPFSEREFISEEEANYRTPWEKMESESEEGTKIRPVIPTPMGLIPIHPFRNFSQAFQIWIGHANFFITPDIQEKIESVPGVEILDIHSPYCFRVGVGKAFDHIEVKSDIQKTLKVMPIKDGELNPRQMQLDEETRAKVELLQKTLKTTHPYWAIYVLPNAVIDTIRANDPDTYDDQIELYKESQKYIGGIIFEHG